MAGLTVEFSTRVEACNDDTGEWLWIGVVASRRADGSYASSVSRWGDAGFTEEEARRRAAEWLETAERNGHGDGPIPGLSSVYRDAHLR